MTGEDIWNNFKRRLDEALAREPDPSGRTRSHIMYRAEAEAFERYGPVVGEEFMQAMGRAGYHR